MYFNFFVKFFYQNLCALCFHRGTFSYPFGCVEECIRGGHRINIILNAMRILIIPLACLLYVSITMFQVYRAARNTEINALRFSFVARFRNQNRKKTMKRSRRIMIQGVLYSVAMILVWIFVIMYAIIIMVSKDEDSNIILFLMNVFTPLLGAFNALIYLIPVFRKMLKTRRQQWALIEKSKIVSNENEENADYDEEKDPTVPRILLSSGEISSGKIYSSSRQMNITAIDEEKEEEEEKREIVSLDPTFRLEVYRDGDEGNIISQDLNNESNSNYCNDDGDDYYL